MTPNYAPGNAPVTPLTTPGYGKYASGATIWFTKIGNA